MSMALIGVAEQTGDIRVDGATLGAAPHDSQLRENAVWLLSEALEMLVREALASTHDNKERVYASDQAHHSLEKAMVLAIED